jgi:hypothetical protein
MGTIGAVTDLIEPCGQAEIDDGDKLHRQSRCVWTAQRSIQVERSDFCISFSCGTE